METAKKLLSSIIEALKAPFPPGLEQYRAGATWGPDDAKKTRPLPYIDARAVFDRLDGVAGPDNWSTELERLEQGIYLCRLTICGVTRTDVGQAGADEGEKDKSGASDAIKRAAVQFGIGRYLYDLEMPVVDLVKNNRDKWELPRDWKPPGRGGAHPAAKPQAQAPTPTKSDSQGHAPAPSSGGGPKPVSDRQLNLIRDEMKRAGWTQTEAAAYCTKHFNKTKSTELVSYEASKLIDHLKSLPSIGGAA